MKTETQRNAMATFGRRHTDAETAARLAEEERMRRIGKAALITFGIVLIAIAIGSWHWQAGFTFAAICAVIAAVQPKDLA